jgi:CheY-like chemotaxis protein
VKLKDSCKSPLAKNHPNLPPNAESKAASGDGFNHGHETTTDAPRRTLLYVEDNPANLKLIEDLIALFPEVEMIAAVNGTLGIQIARATQPQVILMHINRPGISGVKTLTILREDPKTAHIPVIALSANVIPREISKSSGTGFFRHLTKPVKINEFIDTLNAALKFAEPRMPEASR